MGEQLLVIGGGFRAPYFGRGACLYRQGACGTGYAPPVGALWDPVLVAMNAAIRRLEG